MLENFLYDLILFWSAHIGLSFTHFPYSLLAIASLLVVVVLCVDWYRHVDYCDLIPNELMLATYYQNNNCLRYCVRLIMCVTGLGSSYFYFSLLSALLQFFLD